MTMIKCSECGKGISDKAAVCIGCGAPILSETSQETQSSGVGSPEKISSNVYGMVDFEDFKMALSKSTKYASGKVDEAVKLAKEKLQSAKDRDAASIVNLAKSFAEASPVVKTESQINRDKFIAALESTIDVKFAEILSSKTVKDAYLTYLDAQILTSSVRNIFKSALSVTPPQVEASLLLSEAILAPSTKEKEDRLKAAFGVAGGASGIGIVIGAIGSALGWGAGVIAGLGSAFAGASLAGPIGWGVAGLSLAIVAGYFASTSNKQTDTERFIKVLKASIDKAVDVIWDEYEVEFTKLVTGISKS